MSIKDIIERNRTSNYVRKGNREKLSKLLLANSDRKRIVDQADEYILSDLSLEVYQTKVEGYENLYDYIINSKNIAIRINSEYYKDPSIYIPHIKKFKGLPNGIPLTNEILLTKMPNNQTVLEYICDTCEYIFEKIQVTSVEVAKILIAKQRFSILVNSSYEILVTKIDGEKTVLDILKEKGCVPQTKYIKPLKESILFSFNDIQQDILLQKINGKTLLELLLEKGFEFKIVFNPFTDKKEDWIQIAKILYVKERMDLITEAPESFLTEQIHDLRIMDLLKYQKIFPKIMGFMKDKQIIIDYLVNGQEETVLNQISEEVLAEPLYNQLSALDLLIVQYDKKGELREVLSTIEARRMLTPDVTVNLSKYGICIPSEYQKTIGIKKSKDLYNFIYSDREYEVDIEGEELINQFYQAFNDGESDKGLLDLVVKSFKRTYTTDREMALRDMQTLLAYKEKYPAFIFVYAPNKGNSFSEPLKFMTDKAKSSITMNNKNVLESLNHEMGHAIHYLLAGGTTPQEFEDYFNQNKDNYKPVSEAYKAILEESDNLLMSDEDYDREFYKFIEQKYGSKENYVETIRREFNQMYGSKELILETLNDGDYSEDVLNAIINAYYEITEVQDKSTVIDGYVESRINAERKIFRDELYRKTNVEFLCYENFIDAVYEGRIAFEAIITKRTRGIVSKAPTCTHDTIYYSMPDNQFKELYANYVELKKSPKGHMYIEKIKEQIDPQIIEILESFDKSLTLERLSEKKRVA